MSPIMSIQANHGDFVFGANRGLNNHIVRLDSTGAIKWSKKIHGVINGFGILYFIRRTSDDGFITGHYYSPGSGANMMLIRLDSTGTVLWSKMYKSTIHNSYIYDAIETNDGGFIFCGTSLVNNANARGFIGKVDSAGTLLWNKNLDFGSYLSAVTDNGSDYFFAGMYDHPTAFYPDGLIMKTDYSGNVAWMKSYGDYGDNEQFVRILNYDNDHIIIIGGDDDGDHNTTCTKLDTSGNVIWHRNIGTNGEEYGHSIAKSGTDLIVPVTTDNSTVYGGACILKLNIIGGTSIAKYYGGTNFNNRYAINSAFGTSDGGWFGMCYKSSTNETILIKTNASGVSGCNEATSNQLLNNSETLLSAPVFPSFATVIYTDSSIFFSVVDSGVVNTLCSFTEINEFSDEEPIVSVVPNPVYGSGTIMLSEKLLIENIQFILIDTNGKEMMRQEVNSREFDTNYENLSHGIYFYKVEQKGKILKSGKLIIL